MQQSICNCPKEDGTWDANIHGLGKTKLTQDLVLILEREGDQSVALGTSYAPMAFFHSAFPTLRRDHTGKLPLGNRAFLKLKFDISFLFGFILLIILR